jgi:hypothetical protein
MAGPAAGDMAAIWRDRAAADTVLESPGPEQAHSWVEVTMQGVKK